mgnify:CR=1 FL=1|jgi:hypothetical protein
MSTYGFPQHITTGNSSTSTVTITPSNSITAITGTYSELDPIPNTISLGNTRITEEQLGDLLVLLEVVGRLDKSDPIHKQFMAIKCRNKLKGENT